MLRFFGLRIVRIVIFTIVFLAILTLFVLYYYQSQILKKKNVPQITFSDKYKTAVSVKSTEMDLLSGILATDIEDGDLSLDVIIESMSNVTISEDKKTKVKTVTRDITYVVCDSDDNVTKVTKEIKYLDYKEPVIESVDKVPVIRERKYADVLACFKATDVIDGDISDLIKIESLDSSRENIRRGVFPVVLSVTNSCGDTVYYNTAVTLIE